MGMGFLLDNAGQIATGFIAAVVSGIVLALRKIDFVEAWRKRRRRKQTRRTTLRMSAIYRADRALENATVDAVELYGATRAIVFNAHNCGEELVVGGQKFTTAKHGYAINPDAADTSRYEYGQHLVSKYQQVVLTKDYKLMLQEMLAHGSYRFKTEDNLGSQLYQFYKQDKITDSLLFLAWANAYISCYWSVATTRDAGFSDLEISELQLIADRVRSHCEDAHG